MADAAQRAHEPGAAAAVAALPAVLLHRLRRRALGRPARPGFDYPSGYTAFQFVFVLLQSAAFGGVFTGFGIARDFESGFARRLLLAAPNRIGIVFGYAIAAMCAGWSRRRADGRRAGGRDERRRGGVDLFGLYTLAVLVNVAAVLWAAGVAMRLRTMQAGPVMQMPVFLVLFFAPVYVPLPLLAGWIHGVATSNPLTRDARGRPRLHLGPADRGRARLRRRARARGAVLALGPARPAQRRARRLTTRVGGSPPLGGVVATGSPHVLAAGHKARYRAPRLASPSAGHASPARPGFQ